MVQTARSRSSKGPWQEDLIVRVRPGRSIATDSPEGQEPLMQPRYNVTVAGCGCGSSATGTAPERFVYDGTIFTGFRSADDAVLGVWVQVRGVNRWWAYHWSSNYYADSLRLIATGDSDGWHPAMGILTLKNGRYGRPTGF
jgi:hypothetical protein